MSSFLNKHKRQPRLFIDLPTEGKFYDSSVLEKSESLPVFGMTAMDEMLLRTPMRYFQVRLQHKLLKVVFRTFGSKGQLVIWNTMWVMFCCQ